MQAFVPSFTATMLQIPDESLIVIRELGFAAIGIGIVGMLSLKYDNWRIPVSLARGIFILFCTLFHLTRIDIIIGAEILAIVADLWIVLVALFVIINSKYHKLLV